MYTHEMIRINTRTHTHTRARAHTHARTHARTLTHKYMHVYYTRRGRERERERGVVERGGGSGGLTLLIPCIAACIHAAIQTYILKLNTDYPNTWNSSSRFIYFNTDYLCITTCGYSNAKLEEKKNHSGISLMKTWTIYYRRHLLVNLLYKLFTV